MILAEKPRRGGPEVFHDTLIELVAMCILNSRKVGSVPLEPIEWIYHYKRGFISDQKLDSPTMVICRLENQGNQFGSRSWVPQNKRDK